MSNNNSVLIKLDDGLLAKLDAFCEAHYGAPRSRVIREAINHFIETKVENERELRRRFEAIIQDDHQARRDQIKILDGSATVENQG